MCENILIMLTKMLTKHQFPDDIEALFNHYLFFKSLKKYKKQNNFCSR